MKKLVFLSLVGLLGMIAVNSMANFTIQGQVTDAYDGSPLPGVNVIERGTTNGTITDIDGKYTLTVGAENAVLVFTYIGYETEEVRLSGRTTINMQLSAAVDQLEEIVVLGYGTSRSREAPASVASFTIGKKQDKSQGYMAPPSTYDIAFAEHNTEGYSTIHENGFKDVGMNPLSTFSIDVDAASYANMRRYITNGQRPPVDAVRIEEMINYFKYDYPQPEDEHPFTVNYELAECPWNKDNRLLHVGLQGLEIPTDDLPPSNLVFLIDVSGSMSTYNKLPLLKSAFKLLVSELRPDDRVAIVVYAGAAGLVLESTKGKDKQVILDALDRLNAGGSTAGGAGLKLAYKTAEEHFMENGNNRIILATDGDFNVGQSSNAEMERLIEQEREKGISISVLGFGMGNYKDDKMEIIADKGNGNYAYIDNIQEAEKVFVNEFGGTLFTIAKDVKIQIEFNPARVKEYRLVGYENRLLNEEDFDNDKIDAGELGSGHTVTALYEIVLREEKPGEDRLKYQTTLWNDLALESKELATIKFRYKKPDGLKSQLIEKTILDEYRSFAETSNNFRFSAAVAEFGMCLRNSEFKGTSSYDEVLRLASNAKGEDEEGYRSEFVRLVKTASSLK
ncbi:MAG: von Willebrand factor type A domain-containing protein [Bacteroidales bacterium]|nr:von Willebrand factor type A domain-containing protein [Bacteroidales bacterium]